MKISQNELFEERTFESLFLFFIYIYRTEGISLDNSEKGLSYKRATLRNFYVCINFEEVILQFLPLNGFIFKKLF